MSRTIVFLVFGVLKTKYLAFRTPDAHMKVPCLVMFWEEQLFQRHGTQSLKCWKVTNSV